MSAPQHGVTSVFGTVIDAVPVAVAAAGRGIAACTKAARCVVVPVAACRSYLARIVPQCRKYSEMDFALV